MYKTNFLNEDKVFSIVYLSSYTVAQVRQKHEYLIIHAVKQNPDQYWLKNYGKKATYGKQPMIHCQEVNCESLEQ